MIFFDFSFKKITPQKSNNLCVVIPFYKLCLSNEELLSLQLCNKFLSNYEITLLCPMKFKESISSLKLPLDSFQTIFIQDCYLESIESYNKLLLSSKFYKIFIRFEYILIYQLDALILSSNIDSWINKNYSYIGAPWFKKNDRFEFIDTFLDISVGNGGFSLRKVNHFVKVTSSRKKIISFLDFHNENNKNPKSYNLIKNILKYIFQVDTFISAKHNTSFNEDKVFAKAKFRFKYFKVPDPIEACGFSFEYNPRYLLKLNTNIIPLGCHAWEKADKYFFLELLRKIPDYKNLEYLNFLIKDNS